MKKCPACNSSQTNRVSPFRVKQKGNGLLPEDYTVFDCANCGLWFKDEFPTQDNLVKYYQGLSLSDDNWNYANRLPHEKKIDTILKNLHKDAEVLDVGCWTGRLLSVHTHLQRYGIEPNQSSASIANQNGLIILGATATESVLKAKKFDVITLIDVFEHLSNPVEIMGILINHLKTGGKLIIVTGRTDSFPIKLAGITYWYFSIVPDHIVFLNKKFVGWAQQHFACSKVSAKAVCHFHFKMGKFLKEFVWLVIWRYLNPNSPFPKTKLAGLPIFKRLANLKDIIMCTNWKDHYYITIQK